MLSRISFDKFLEWESYESLEPFFEQRIGTELASIVAAIVNVNRNPKRRSEPYPISDFVIKWGDDPAVQARKQTWQQMKMIAQMIAAAYAEPERQANLPGLEDPNKEPEQDALPLPPPEPVTEEPVECPPPALELSAEKPFSQITGQVS